MSNLNKPNVEELFERSMKVFEETFHIQLTDEQKLIYLFGFGDGITTVKNFPDNLKDISYDLFTAVKTSSQLNSYAKEWSKKLL